MVEDWSMADLVLANSTCFDMYLMKQIDEKSKSMKKGSIFVTLTKKLPSAEPLRDDPDREWEFIYSIKKKMSWGDATVNIH